MRWRTLLLAGLLVALPLSCQANVGIPGPMLWFFGSMTDDGRRWLLCCMVMCVGVEWAIYRYMGLFNRPFVVSLWVNILSCILGIPIGLLGAIDPTWFILPTLVSALSEGFFARHPPGFLGARTIKPVTRGNFYARVLIANLVSNLIMVGYLYISIWKSHANPADFAPWLRYLLF